MFRFFLSFIMFFWEGEEVVDFELGPDKVGVVVDFVDQLPPGPAADDALDQEGVVAPAHEHLVGRVQFVGDADVQPVAEVHLPQEVLERLELALHFAPALARRPAQPKHEMVLLPLTPLHQNILLNSTILSFIFSNYLILFFNGF
jgi:hypothetical protein